MSTTAIDAVNSTSAATAQTSAARMPTQTLDQQDFLKLLVAQLSSQDPMNPQKDTDFIGQMAQFSSLEQLRGVQSSLTQLQSDQRMTQSNNMIGRYAVVQSGSQLVSGTVTAMTIQDGVPKLTVNGQDYDLSTVRSLTTPTATPAATPTN